MVAKAGVPLVHVPPAVASVRVVLVPGHTIGVPAIGCGSGLTVTCVTVWQPPAVSVNVIFELPAATPVTVPVVDPIVATAGVELLHVPAPLASVSVIADPMHTGTLPDGVTGVWFTVTTFVTVVPQVAK